VGKVELRVANVKDAPRLLEIYTHYVLHTAISFEIDPPSLEEFTSRMETIQQKYPYLVVVEDGKIMGYAYGQTFINRSAYDHCAELTIYLDKDAKKKGYGRMLYEELEKRLFAMGITNLYACIGDPIVEDEYLNRNSEEFHSHMGFVKNGVFHKSGYKFDRYYNMIWMEKILEN
jgi:phosphinothricin acetyltransferase